MRKWVSSWKIEWLLLTRSIWTWLVLAISLAMAGMQFFSRILRHDPGGALTSTAFVVQGGLLVAMFLGLTLIRRESVAMADEIFEIAPNGFRDKVIGKFLLMFSAVALFLCLSFTVLSVMYAIEGVPAVFYGKAISYLVLYWGLPFLVAGMIGLTVAMFVRSRLIYPLFALIWLLIGPMNLSVFQTVMSLLKIDLTQLLHFLNLGQTDPYAPYDPVYGLPMEIHRWLQIGIWFFVALFALVASTQWKNSHKRSRRSLLLLASTLVPLVPLIWFFNQPEQVIQTAAEANSVRKYDLIYYAGHAQPAFEAGTPFRVESYDIDLTAHRSVQATVKMSVTPQRETDTLVFTLYHDLHVQQVTFGDHREAHFQQKEDQVQVTFPQPIPASSAKTLTVQYAGISSPYFPANEQAVQLPAYFPWLPTPGASQAMLMTNELKRMPLFMQHPAKYVLHYQGPQPLYTNLSSTGAGTYEGEAPHGITLAAGMMTEATIAGKNVYYPVSLYRGISEMQDYLAKSKGLNEQIAADLALPHVSQEPSKYFLLSVPNESMQFPANNWYLGDHQVIGIGQMFNQGGLLADDNNMLTGNLMSLIQNERVIHQNPAMLGLFAKSYSYWYGRKNGRGKFENTPMLEQDLKLYQNMKLEEPAQKTEAVLKFLDQHANQPALVQSLFRNWLKRLDSTKMLNWNDIDSLLAGAK